MTATTLNASRVESPAYAGIENNVILARDTVQSKVAATYARGSIERLARGVYLPTARAAGPGRDAERRALARVAAAERILGAAHWFSHETAALLWGCAVLWIGDRTHITQLVRPGAGSDPAYFRHHHDLPEWHRTVLAGLPVTTLERTLVDCASSLPGEHALVVADSALRLGADPGHIDDVIRSRSGRRGVVQARRIRDLADGRVESPGESRLRWLCHSRGLPMPEPQVEVPTRLGRFRLDLALREYKVAIEFDGFVKYSGELGSTAAEAVFAEKRRQDALEEAGWVVIRVTWADFANSDDLALRIRRALRRRPGSARPRTAP